MINYKINFFDNFSTYD